LTKNSLKSHCLHFFLFLLLSIVKWRILSNYKCFDLHIKCLYSFLFIFRHFVVLLLCFGSFSVRLKSCCRVFLRRLSQGLLGFYLPACFRLNSYFLNFLSFFHQLEILDFYILQLSFFDLFIICIDL